MDLKIDQDLENCALTVVATFDHPVDKVWDLYADPRKLERFWGPPEYPATVTEHDLRAGGEVRYYMTSPEGQKHYGLWRITSVEPGRQFVAEDFFAEADGQPMAGMPTSTFTFTFTEVDGRTEMTSVSKYSSVDELEKVLAMGMIEGLTAAMGQIEGVLADS